MYHFSYFIDSYLSFCLRHVCIYLIFHEEIPFLQTQYTCFCSFKRLYLSISVRSLYSSSDPSFSSNPMISSPGYVAAVWCEVLRYPTVFVYKAFIYRGFLTKHIKYQKVFYNVKRFSLLSLFFSFFFLSLSLQSWFRETLCHSELRLLLWLQLQISIRSIVCLLELPLKRFLLRLCWWHDTPSWIRCSCRLTSNLIPWNPCLRCCSCCVLLQKIRLKSKSSLPDELHSFLLHFPCVLYVTHNIQNHTI